MERGLLDPKEGYERYRLNFSPFAGFREVALGLAGVSCFVWIWDQASSLGLCLEGERSMGFIGVQTRGWQGRLPRVFCCSIDDEIQALILGEQRLRRKSVSSLSGCLICMACWLDRVAC